MYSSNFLKALSSASRIPTGDLKNLPKELLIDTIYSKVLWLEGNPTGEKFMSLMAEHGKTIFDMNNYSGANLLAAALQRINQNWNRNRLISKAGWQFLQKQTALCLKAEKITNVDTKKEVEKIIFNFINHIDGNGNLIGGFIFNGTNGLSTSAEDIRKWAWTWAEKMGLETMFEYLAKPTYWQRHKEFFRTNLKLFKTDVFCERIGICGLFKARKLRKALNN